MGEDIARFSDLAEFRGAIERLREAVVVLARAIDAQAERQP
jgi:hypothetical protein